MGVLDAEVALYETLRADLEQGHKGKWALIHRDEFVGGFATFEEAGRVAVRRFGRGPYLIREVGAPPLMLPYRFLIQGGVPANAALSAHPSTEFRMSG